MSIVVLVALVLVNIIARLSHLPVPLLVKASLHRTTCLQHLRLSQHVIRINDLDLVFDLQC